MLLVELPLFARSGLGVGIEINTLMSSGSAILFFHYHGLTIFDYLLKLKSLRNKYILPSAILCQLGVVDLLQQDPRHPRGQGGAGVETQINPSEKLGGGDKRRT